MGGAKFAHELRDQKTRSLEWRQHRPAVASERCSVRPPAGLALGRM